MSEPNSDRSSANRILRDLRNIFEQDYAVAIGLAVIYAAVVLAIGLLIWPSQKLELRGVEPAVVWHVREFLLGKTLYPRLMRLHFRSISTRRSTTGLWAAF